MTIENWERFKESLPDWSILDGCFGQTNIKPSDVDGCVERNGLFLFLEHKGSGVGIKQGQARLFKAMAAQGNTVIVFWGVGREIEEILVYQSGRELVKVKASLSDLRREVSAWYERVDNFSR